MRIVQAWWLRRELGYNGREAVGDTRYEHGASAREIGTASRSTMGGAALADKDHFRVLHHGARLAPVYCLPHILPLKFRSAQVRFILLIEQVAQSTPTHQAYSIAGMLCQYPLGHMTNVSQHGLGVRSDPRSAHEARLSVRPPLKTSPACLCKLAATKTMPHRDIPVMIRSGTLRVRAFRSLEICMVADGNLDPYSVPRANSSRPIVQGAFLARAISVERVACLTLQPSEDTGKVKSALRPGKGTPGKPRLPAGDNPPQHRGGTFRFAHFHLQFRRAL